MPGTIIFRPLEATLPKTRRGSIDTFLSFTAGDQKAQSEKCGEAGSHLHWNDEVKLKVKDQHTCLVELKDQEASTMGSLGSLEVNLDEIEEAGTVRRWYPIYENNQNIGEVLLEAQYTSDEHKHHVHEVSTTSTVDTCLQSIEEQIKHQGSVPKGLDLDDYFREKARWGLEPDNSQVKVAETNEFGDYQPHKAMPFGELMHQHGSGRIDQGSYYSGQQTSYGEAYPMTHKSVGTNLLGNYRPDRGEAYDRVNPKGYAMFMSQAFEPHDKYDFVLMDEEATGSKVTSVVEKAYQQYNQNRRYLPPSSRASSSHTARVSLGTTIEPSDISNDQYHSVRRDTANEGILPYKYDEYGKVIGELEETGMKVGGSEGPKSVEVAGPN